MRGAPGRAANPARNELAGHGVRPCWQPHGRGRDEDCSPPPAQIPACAANAPGSSLGSNVGRHAVKPRVLRRKSNRIDVATRLSVRTTAAYRPFPSGEALPSTISAGSCLPLFDRFLGTTTSSDFSPTYMLGVRLLPSRVDPARSRAQVVSPVNASRRPSRDAAHHSERTSRQQWAVFGRRHCSKSQSVDHHVCARIGFF
jgi:hypothetical protein